MTARLTALVLATALLGFLVGARALGSSASPPASAPAASAGTRDVAPLRGGFWRPAGSDAKRPVVSLRQTAWSPAGARDLREPGALASLEAVVRLASTE